MNSKSTSMHTSVFYRKIHNRKCLFPRNRKRKFVEFVLKEDKDEIKRKLISILSRRLERRSPVTFLDQHFVPYLC